MRQLPWVIVSAVILIVAGLWLAGCVPRQPQEAVEEPGYLEPFRPALISWTPADEIAWQFFPRYHISATLDLDNLILVGQESVRFVNRQDTELSQVLFRLYPNLPQQGGVLTVKKVKSKGIALSYQPTAHNTAIAITCEPPLKPGQIAEFDLEFSVDIPDPQDGWVIFGRNQNIISLPDFYPMLAVYTNQGWSLKLPPFYADAGFAEAAFYDVSITHRADWVMTGSGVIISQTPRADGRLTTRFVAGPIREFVVITSPDYEVITTKAGKTTVKSYYLREDADGGRFALWRAASALRVYSDAFGPYPFTQLIVAEAPLTYRGMEFPMLSLCGIDAYRAWRKELGYLIIHEIAHQWWYSQVGNDPYETPWLDEGLAEYSAYTYFERVKGRQVAEELREQRWLQSYNYAITNNMDTILAQPASAFPSYKVYEMMTYAKAALFFDALRRAVGDEAYYEILKEYVHRNRFQIVLPEHFFNIAQEISGRDLTPLIAEWILSSRNTGEQGNE